MPLGHKDEGGDSPPPPPRYKEKDDLLPMRLPWTMWMNTNCKNHFVASLGEFVGTAMFLFFAFSGTEVAKAKASTPADSRQVEGDPAWDPTVFIYIALCFGFSLMVNVWIFFRISGGLFNPAVTLALWVTRAFGAWRALCLFVAQILGAIAAAGMVLAIFPAPLNVQTTLSDGTSIAQGYMIEMLMTAELVFTILMLAKEKHKATFIAPVGIGLALFVAELAGVYYTGGSLNPARSLGPALVTNTWDSHHWIYWAAPASGAVIAIAFYFLIKTLEYEMANPGQDGDEANDPTKNPSHEVRERQRAKTARILARLGMDTSQQAGGSSTPQMNEVELLGTKDAMLDVEKGVGTHPGYMASSASVGGEHDSPTRPFAAHGRMSPRQSMHNEPA
ncbi:aquaporin-like protein [Phyllosticta capitalensis]|uniref:Aquaporin-like protein n=1 Tax=Phyllosticta capitalensis TaxID=121624 RepID=A0ABR1YII8_9PEZI